jgi:hypothetical protein
MTATSSTSVPSPAPASIAPAAPTSAGIPYVIELVGVTKQYGTAQVCGGPRPWRAGRP